MKTLVVVLALLVASSAAFAAETQNASIDVYDNWTYLGLPLVPIQSFPNPPQIFGPAGVDVEWTGTLSKLDAPTGNTVYYEAWNPGAGDWNMLLGEGYQLFYPAGNLPTNPTTVTYTGIKDGVPDALGNQTDMWISLPGNQIDGQNAGGVHWISTPFNHAIPFNVDFWDGANIKVTDGNTVRTLLDAVSAGWITEPWVYLDGLSQNALYAGYMSGVYDSDQLEPGKMYIVQTLVDNLALIIPAAVPGS